MYIEIGARVHRSQEPDTLDKGHSPKHGSNRGSGTRARVCHPPLLPLVAVPWGGGWRCEHWHGRGPRRGLGAQRAPTIDGIAHSTPDRT